MSSETLSRARAREAVGPNQDHALFSATMGYVAFTAALFALGSYLGRGMLASFGIAAFVASFACLMGLRSAAKRSRELTVVLLGAFGALLGLTFAPTLSYYASVDPRTLWEAGGATALFIAGSGAGGWATRRSLSAVARACSWALVALIVAGIALIFAQLPGTGLVYSVLGLVVFAGFTMFDFQRLRRTRDINAAPLLAASIFLDILNAFSFFLGIFSGSDR